MLTYISRPKYNRWNVYVHNLNGFDAAFFLHLLTSTGKVKPNMRDGRIIKLTYTPRDGVI